MKVTYVVRMKRVGGREGDDNLINYLSNLLQFAIGIGIFSIMCYGALT